MDHEPTLVLPEEFKSYWADEKRSIPGIKFEGHPFVGLPDYSQLENADLESLWKIIRDMCCHRQDRNNLEFDPYYSTLLMSFGFYPGDMESKPKEHLFCQWWQGHLSICHFKNEDIFVDIHGKKIPRKPKKIDHIAIEVHDIHVTMDKILNSERNQDVVLNNVSDNYTKLVASYNDLAASHNQLTASYKTIATSHDSLMTSHNQLSASYELLSDTYNELSQDYNSISLSLERADNEISELRKELQRVACTKFILIVTLLYNLIGFILRLVLNRNKLADGEVLPTLIEGGGELLVSLIVLCVMLCMKK